MKKIIRTALATAVAAVVVASLAGCDGLGAFGEQFDRAMHGVSATMKTYNAQGQEIDEVKGKSFEIERDTRFDSTDSDGSSNSDSQVLLISLGKDHISHVGSSMVLAQDGIVNVSDQVGDKMKLVNTDAGTPWLNNLLEYNRNLWQGKGKTIMIRSQQGDPIAVFAGNDVNILPTDVPKSTWFRVDGKYLFVYRSDYTVYDNALLAGRTDK